MKIYNEIVFDVDGNVVYEDSFEYSGDVMLLQEDNRYDINKDGGVNILDLMKAPPGMRREIAEYLAGDRDLTAPQQATSILEIANPLPSLPSISNVGAQSFSGSVNTQAIPGGFQPLPQVAGTIKKIYQLSQFHGGLNEKSSPRDISDQECQVAENVSFSDIGKIKLLGVATNTDNSISTHAIGTTDRGKSGYGLFQFTAPAAADGTATAGAYTITLFPDGDRIDFTDSSGNGAFIDYNGSVDGGADNDDVAHVMYAAGNGLYANDANFANLSSNNPRKAKIYVDREDFNGLQTTTAWQEGKALIDSPTYHGSNAAGKVNFDNDDEAVGSDIGFTVAAAYGSATVHIGSDGDASGNWGLSGATAYIFYISWLFDGGHETGLTALGTASFTKESLFFNFSCKAQSADTDGDSTDNHIGLDPGGSYSAGEPRIEGARIYYRNPNQTERWLLAEVFLPDGVLISPDSTYHPWVENSNVFQIGSNISSNALKVVSPPDLYSYIGKNTYYHDEVYTKSSDTAGDTTPTAHDLRYKTAVVGSGGTVFIGNISFRGRLYIDSMMFSAPNRPGVFPQYNRFDSPSSDGSPINVLASFADKILQFKDNAMYAINISNGPAGAYAEASFRDCGVRNPCQVFTTSFGVVFANKHGCFIYDGNSVISLTHGKFDVADWGLSENNVIITGDTSYIPCVGYDPRSHNIIVLKDIGDNADNDDAWVYNMDTRSWSEAKDIIVNADNTRFSNFIITSGGYLSILNHDATALHNYNHVIGASQTIDYRTKDIDFGLPSQTKKIFKVYVTYQPAGTVPTMTYGVDGDLTPTESFNSGSFATSGTVTTTAFTVSGTGLTGIKSLSLKIQGSTHQDFEIQDIAIIYRVRPLK